MIFHILSGYGAHIFVKNLGTTNGKINCIPNNEEKYILFTKIIKVDRYTPPPMKKNRDGEMKEKNVKRDIRFIDSFKFMASTLERLVAHLPNAAFRCTSRYFEGEQLRLLKRKGAYP